MSKPNIHEVTAMLDRMTLKLCQRNVEIARLREENTKLNAENEQLIDELAEYKFIADLNETVKRETMYDRQLDWVEEQLIFSHAKDLEEASQ